MKSDAVIEELEKRGGTLFVRGGKMLVTPSGLLDDTLRDAMRECRPELEEWAEKQAQEFYCDVLEAFDASEEAATEERDFPCEHPRLTDHCRDWTKEQLWGMSASLLAAKCRREGKGCGDCVIAHGRMRLDKWQHDREEEAQKARKRERAQMYYRSNGSADTGTD